jgi:dinuclear metal center YbgI/SA1388 family protein
MSQLSDIVADLTRFLQATGFEDFGPNGLQVPGAAEVHRVVTGVSAQMELFERAVELEAQLILVHHGLFWSFHPLGLDRRRLERLRVLLEHDLSLLAYHLPLDAHPEVGNNALLAEALGCVALEPFGQYRGRAIGRLGRFPEADGIEVGELLDRVSAATGGRTPLLQGAGPERVRTIAIVSGSAADALDEAIDLGCDAFLTGEPREHVMADAREAGIHFLAAGHYATETFGVKALGERLASRFGIEHVFVDLPNPV